MYSIIDKIERAKIAVRFEDEKKLQYFLKCCGECGYNLFETLVVDTTHCYHINTNYLSIVPQVFSDKKESLLKKGFRVLKI